QRLRVRPIDDLGIDIEEIEHRLNIDEALPDLAIDEADEIERDRQLHEQRIDEHEIADGLLATHDGRAGHDHADCHANGKDDHLANVKPGKGRPYLRGGLLVARHRAIEAAGLHLLVAEILHRLEIEKRVD